MISDRLKKFHAESSLGYILGTRDDQLKPSVSKPTHAKISDDGSHITFYMSNVDFETHESNLSSNGQLALSCAALPSHESYQYKGVYKNHRPATEEETGEIFGALERFGAGIIEMGFPSEMMEMFQDIIVVPATAIEFEVAEIFEQTPKPGTGNKI
ncbi:hypothetical protein JYT25_00785 [bacterium AH-315-C20]|nr:hypothetical protein [bacterium AH-315-C20]